MMRMMTMCYSSAAAILVVFALPSTGYMPYWNENSMSEKGYPGVYSNSKYPYYPKDGQTFYPPPFSQQHSRGEDAYPGKFLGMGTVNSYFGGRQVELICNLNEADGKIVSNVVWTKVEGAHPFLGDNPSNDCPRCTYDPIDYDDHRIKAYNYNGKAILFIHEVHGDDYGTYRCSATALVSYHGDIETVYQVVEL